MKTQLLKKILISAFVIFGFTNVNAQLFDFTGSSENFIVTGAASVDITSGTTMLITASDNRGNVYIEQETVANGGAAIDADTYKALRVVVKNNTALNRLSLRLAAGNATVGSFQTISTPDAAFQTYIFDLSGAANWSGSVESWRIFLGFNNTGVGNAETLEFDSIEFLTVVPPVAEAIITILDIQQVGINPVDVGQIATFEVTYKTDTSGPDITGNTFRLYQGGGVHTGFPPITYAQTGGASTTTQISFTWEAGYTSGVYDMRLFNAGDKTDFDWAATGHTAAVNSNTDPAAGYLGVDVNVGVVSVPASMSGIVQNPSFEDLGGSVSPFNPNGVGGATIELSSDFAKTGTYSLKHAYSNGTGSTQTQFVFNNYIHDLGASTSDFIIGSVWVKVVRPSTPGVSPLIDVQGQGRFGTTLVVGDLTTKSDPKTTTKTDGTWEKVSFAFTPDGPYSTAQFRYGIGGADILDGDIIYVDDLHAEVTPTLSVKENTLEGVAIYPNPASGLVNVSSLNGGNISIHNILGARVLNETTTSKNHQLNVSSLKSGIYLLRVVSDNKSLTKKLIIR